MSKRDGERQRETLYRALGILQKKREEVFVGARGVKDSTRKPTEPTNLSSYGLTETELTKRKPSWD